MPDAFINRFWSRVVYNFLTAKDLLDSCMTRSTKSSAALTLTAAKTKFSETSKGVPINFVEHTVKYLST